MMVRLLWSVLLLCLTAHGDNVIWKRPGENVTFECCFTKCPSSIDGFPGMYLYHYSPVKEEVLFYHFHSDKESIQPRTRYLNRLMTKGSLRNHTITIQYLNTNDSGIYKCVYKDIDAEVVCNDYTLFISVTSFQATVLAHPPLRNMPLSPNEEHPPLLLITVATSAISIFLTTVVILLIIKMKHCNGKTTSGAPPEDVYEIMTKNRPQPVAAPE